jgi:hypothetical protein
MKKILVTLLVSLFTLNGVANQTSSLLGRVQTKEMYDFTQVNLFCKVVSTNVSTKTKSKCEKIMKQFAEDMLNAFNSSDRKKKTIKAINKNIDRMYLILDEAEYKSYLRVLNEEMSIRGIDWF